MSKIKSRQKKDKAIQKTRGVNSNILENERGIFFNMVRDAIFVADAKTGMLVDANRAALKMIGRSLSEVRKMHQKELHPRRFRKEYVTIFKDSVKSRGVRKNILVVNKKGDEIITDINSSIIRLNGRLYLQGIFRDVTEKNKTENSLRESKEKLELITRAIPEGMDIVDKELNIVWMNEKFLKIFGKSSIGKKCYKVYKDNMKQCHSCPLKKPIRLGEVRSHTVQGVAGGKIFEITHKGIIYKGKKSILEIFRDVTERKKADQLLRDNENKFKDLYDNAPDSYQSFSSDGTYIQVNKTWLKTFGYSESELIGKMKFSDLIPSSYLPQFREHLKQLKKGKSITNFEYLVRRKNGSFVPVVINATGVYDNNKSFVMSRAILRDVTEKREAEEELRASEARFRSLVQSSTDCIKLFDLKGNLQYINPAGLKEHRLKSLEEALRIKWHPLQSIIQGDKILFKKAHKKAVRGGVSVIEVRHTKEGSIREVCSETIIPVKNRKGKATAIVAISRDVTEKNRVEKELEDRAMELEEQQEAILNIVEDVEEEKERAETYLKIAGNIIVALDRKGRVTLANKKANEILGYENGDLIGKNWFNTCLPKKSVKEVKGVFNRIINGDIELVEQYENPIITKDGKQKIISWHNSLIYGDDGEIVGTLSSGEDMTELKKIDKAKTEFVSLASHQLRTPLTAINWFSEMLASGEVGGLNKEQKEYLSRIIKSNRRMVKLISSLLNVSRIELGTFIINPEQVNINLLIKGVVSELLPGIKEKNLRFKKEVDVAMRKKIKLDKNLIRIIIQNLLSNAVKYTPKNGKIALKVKKSKEDFVVSVSDSGYGIPESAKDKVFTKLFRADNIKDKDTDGTGLGLYIAKMVIDHVGGKIWFKSKENMGSTFYFSIPLKGMQKKKGTKVLE